MKKKLIAGAMAGAALLAMAAPLMAAKPEKVDVCHVIEANDVVYGFWGVVDLHFGKIISVSANAVDAHIAHGDKTVYSAAQGPIDLFRAAGVHLPSAECWVNYPMQ